METIAKLIELALFELQENCLIDWVPGDGEPETFEAECEISSNRYWVGPKTHGYQNGDYFVIMHGVFCIIDMEHLEVWHSSRIHDEVICRAQPCDYCTESRVEA